MKRPDQGSTLRKRGSISGVLRDTSRSLFALLGLMLLLPALLAGWFAWRQYQTVTQEAEEMAQRSVVALQEHVANVLNTHSLLLTQVAEMTKHQSWEEIRNDLGLQRHLSVLASQLKEVAMIGMADAEGRLLVHSERASGDASVADRDFFLAHKTGSINGLFFSEAYASEMNGKRKFAISIARTDLSGAFDGIIYASVPVDYFTGFWKQFVPRAGYLVPLIREDGVVLARYPQLNPVRQLDPNGPFVSHIRHSPVGTYTAVSKIDGIERINSYSQVRTYPLYISFSVEKQLIWKTWRTNMMPGFILALIFMASSLLLWFLVAQQSYRQRASTIEWRKTASELKNEITRRENAEEALRQGQKLEALGKLAGGIAHDFNNLLSGIVGNLELMKLHLQNGSLDAVARSITAAQSVATTATAITQRLLGFSRREALTPSVTDVNDRIIIVEQLLVHTVGANVAIHIVLADDPCKTLCDPNQLDTALLNLAINARDAMPQGGKLEIATALLRFESEVLLFGGKLAAGDYVAITVADTGTGMPPEILGQVLEPFFTTKPAGKGTGLGLPMVYGFVTESGGQLHVDSVPGEGTKVTLYLPKLNQ